MNNRQVIDVLNDLIETCKDGAYGFRASSLQVRSPILRANLLARSSECARAAEQLRVLVLQLGGQPEERSSTIGATHRGWVALRTLSSHDDLAVLEDCEGGEDAALGAYRQALERELPVQIRELIESQYEAAKRNHVEVRNARDSLRAAARS